MAKKNKLKVEEVWSPIEDMGISKHLKDSAIWNNCERLEDVDPEVNNGFVYSIAFDGTKPVQVNNIKEYS